MTPGPSDTFAQSGIFSVYLDFICMSFVNIYGNGYKILSHPILMKVQLINIIVSDVDVVTFTNTYIIIFLLSLISVSLSSSFFLSSLQSFSL